MVDGESVVAPHAQTAMRTVNQQALIVLTGRAEVIVLNESGTLLWLALAQRQSVAALATHLTAAFRVEIGQALLDTQAFVESLLAIEAVQIVA